MSTSAAAPAQHQPQPQPRRPLVRLLPVVFFCCSVFLLFGDHGGLQELVERSRAPSVGPPPTLPPSPEPCLADSVRRLQAAIRRTRVFPHAVIPFTLDAVAMSNTCLYPPSPRDALDDRAGTPDARAVAGKGEGEENGPADGKATTKAASVAPAGSADAHAGAAEGPAASSSGAAGAEGPAPAQRQRRLGVAAQSDETRAAAAPGHSPSLPAPWAPWPGYSLPRYRVDDFCWLMVTGTKTRARAKAQRETWMRHVPPERIWYFADEDFPEVGAITLPELKGGAGVMEAQHRQARGLLYLFNEHPEAVADCKWFMMTDDDVFINLPALFHMLHGLDWRMPLAIGYQMHRGWWHAEIEKLTFTCGGTLAFSRPSALILRENLYRHPSCMVPYSFDVAMGHCLQEFDAIHVHTPLFENDAGQRLFEDDRVKRQEMWSQVFSFPAIHHISPDQIRQAYTHWTAQYDAWHILEERLPVLDDGIVWG